METFGLGLVLSLTDNLSSGVSSAIASITGLISSLEDVNSTASTVSLMALCSVAEQVGDAFESAGERILGVFSSAFSHIMDTGSLFEDYKVQLTALYGDAEKAVKELDLLKNFAVKSPVDMTDVMPYITKFKTLGLEAFDAFENKAQSTNQSLIQWTTDLMSIYRNIDPTRMSKAVVNFLNPKNTRSLMMMKNIIGDIDSLLESQGDTLANDIEGRVRNLTSIVTAIGGNGITESLMGTWSTMLSNMDDVFTMFWSGIADGGAFDSVKKSLIEIVDAMNAVDSVKFGQVLSDGLKIITVPLEKIAHLLSVAIKGFTDFATVHPLFVRIAIGALAVFGVLLVVSGLVLKLGAQFGMLAIGIKIASGALAGFNGGSLIKTIGGLGSKLKVLGIALGVLYLMWKKDFAGIKTKTQTFVNNIRGSFSTAKKIISSNCRDMGIYLSYLNPKDPFDNVTRGLVKLGVLIGAVREGLAHQDGSNFILSLDTYNKLASLGLLNIVGRIFDMKYAFDKFIEGFKTGWQEASDTFKSFIDKFKVKIKGTFLEDLIDKLAQVGDIMNRDKFFGFFEKLGESAGKIAPLVLTIMALKAPLKIVGGLLGGLGSSLNVGGLFGMIGSGLSGLGGFIGGGLGGALSMALPIALKVLNPANVLSLVTTPLLQVFSGLGGVIASGATSVLNSFIQVFSRGALIPKDNFIVKAFTDIAKPSNFSSVFSALSKVITDGVTSPFKLAFNIFKGIGGKLVAVISSPITAIVALVTGIGTAFGQAYDHFDGFKQWVNDSLGLTKDLDFSTMFDGLKAGFEGMMTNLKDAFGDIISLDWLFDGLNLSGGDGIFSEKLGIGNLMSQISGSVFGGGGFDIGAMFEDMKNTILGFWDAISPVLAYIGVAFANFSQVVWDVIGIVGQAIGILAQTIAPLLQGAVSEIVIVFTSAWEVIKGIIEVVSGVVNVIVGVFQGIAGFLSGDADLANAGKEKILSGFDGILGGIEDIFDGIFDFLGGTVANFISMGANIIDGLIEGVSNAWDSITEVFSKLVTHVIEFFKGLLGIHSPSTVFAEIGTNIVQGLINGVQSMINFVISIFTYIVDGIVTVFTGIIDVVGQIGSTVVTLFSSNFQLAKDTVVSIFSTLVDFFRGVWDNIVALFSGEISVSEFFGNIFQLAMDAITSIFDTLSGYFSGVWDNVTTAMSSFGDTVSGIWEGIKTTITSAIDTAKSNVKSAIDKIKGFFDFSWSLPKLKLPHFTTTGSFNWNPPSVPKIGVEWYAKGGVFNAPSVIGVGEAGKEAVMPLESNTGWINILAGKITNLISGNTSAQNSLNQVGRVLASAIGYLSTNSTASRLDGVPVIVDANPNGDDSIKHTTLTPVVRSGGEGTYTNNYNTGGSYITKTTSTTTGGNTDNSVKFERGSIIVQANGSSEAEAERLATLIMKKIERKKQLNNMTNYKFITES